MDPIRISFSSPLTDAGLIVTRSAIRELQELLTVRLIEELDIQIATNKYGTQAFKGLRTNAAHLRWEVTSLESTHLELKAAPIHRLAGAFDHSTDLCSLWLRAVTEDWIHEKLGPGFVPFKVEFPNNAALEQYSGRQSVNKSGSQSGAWFRRIALVLFLLIIGTLGFTLYKIYRMVDEVNHSYTEIESTVNRKTEEILDKIEQGITTSDRVVNMVDKVKNLVIPADSSSDPQD